MKQKFKGQVYRDAIEKLDAEDGYVCRTLEITMKARDYADRFSQFFAGRADVAWVFSNDFPGNFIYEKQYYADTKLGRRTREIALELAAHLEDIGEMDKIL